MPKRRWRDDDTESPISVLEEVGSKTRTERGSMDRTSSGSLEKENDKGLD